MGYPKQITVDKIHAKRDKPDVTVGEFDRDMTRLLDLRNHYDNPGLNTHELNEVEKLLEKYDIDYNQWTRREMFQ